nr:putative mitochondrial protein [Tanacetum cinerariifolium]
PLPVPNLIWTDISMDFIKGLPLSHGKSVILLVVDRLNKYSHFIALSHPFTATQVANFFLDHIYKLHGLPKTIVGQVACKLLLPATSQIHPIFHISKLNLYTSQIHPIPNAIATLPVFNSQGELTQQPVKVLDRRLGKVGNSVALYVLIQWSNSYVDDATWELHSGIVKRFPDFLINSRGQEFGEESGIDMD